MEKLQRRFRVRRATIVSALFLAALMTSQRAVYLTAQAGTVAGQVRALDGRPATRLRVAAQVTNSAVDATDAASFLALTETDDDGHYRLGGLPPGRYYIVAGLVNSPTYYPGVVDPTAARAVTVAPGSDLTGLDFTLVRTAFIRISGRITGFPPGIPPGLISMVLFPVGQTSLSSIATPVQVDGTFEFPRAPAGSNNLRPDLFGTGTRVVASDKDVHVGDIALPPLLGGKVVMDDGTSLPTQSSPTTVPANWASLIRVITRANTGSIRQAVTSPRRDGAFVFLWLGSESTLAVEMLPFGYYVKSLRLGSVDLLTSPVRVASQDVVLTLTRTPPPGAASGVSVTGRIVGLDSPQRPPQWMTLSGLNSNRVPGLAERIFGETAIRADGTFEIYDVIPGTYRIGISPTVLPEGTPTLVVPITGLKNVDVGLTPQRPAQ